MVPRDTANAQQAWADYLSMGGTRSLDRLLARYRSDRAAGKTVPTTRYSTIADWSRKLGWQQRLVDLAAQQAKEAEERHRERYRLAFETGVGLDFERSLLLHNAEERLRHTLGLSDEQMQTWRETGRPVGLRTEDRFWVDDVKAIGFGKSQERVDLEKFNDSLYTAWLKTLNDIAIEKGDRGRKPLDPSKDLDDIADELNLPREEVRADFAKNAKAMGWTTR